MLKGQGWEIAGTSRDAGTRSYLQTLGYQLVDFPDSPSALENATHLLISNPLDKNWKDPVLEAFPALMGNRQWIGYLSTTGVYGDHQGEWVDENTVPKPNGERAAGRLKAENKWRALGGHVFRLAGIYGPERNVLAQLKDGTARPIYKKDQVFSRIHVEDIARVIMASIQKPSPDAIYNVCDDLPAASHEVLEYAAQLLKLPAPALIPFEQASLSPMAKEFYESSRRVRNDKIKTELGVKLLYPTYREGLVALLESEK